MNGLLSAKERVARLSLWKGPVKPERLTGGITNMNFTVEDGGERFVVRVGDDLPVHQILRFNEAAASRAAHAAGISPEVMYSEPGILVMRFIEGKTLAAEDIRDSERLARIVPLLKRVLQPFDRSPLPPIQCKVHDLVGAVIRTDVVVVVHLPRLAALRQDVTPETHDDLTLLDSDQRIGVDGTDHR
jgi:hypothetical protein